MSNKQYSLPIGARLKQYTYRIEKILGQGTFGITYLEFGKRALNRTAIESGWLPAFVKIANSGATARATACNSATVTGH